MNNIARTLFPDKALLFDNGNCTDCKKPVNPTTDFNDELSKKEYSLSGMCQACQDAFFH